MLIVTPVGFIVILIIAGIGFLMIDTSPSEAARRRLGKAVASIVPEPSEVTNGQLLFGFSVIALISVFFMYITCSQC
jgi:amino acid transporter